MDSARGFSAFFKRSLFALGCLGLIGYFGYHVMHGDYGLRAWYRLRGEAESLRAELVRAQSRRMMLEGKVALLRSDSLDPDMLDERAREALNFVHPNDIVILRNAR